MRDRGLVLIGAFKLVKSVLLIGVGLAALKLVRGDAAELFTTAARYVHLDPRGHLLQRLVSKVGVLSEKQLAAIAFGTFAYAAIFLVEGAGLLARKRWAEWVTIIVTASFLPLEVWELLRGASAPKIATLVVNVAILVYLVIRVRKHR